jgi:predicted amidohydrolase
MQAKRFYECDYYTPSDDGFKVYNTPFGKIGIVICFDRHLPESIRACALAGAQLIIVPTANTKDEPSEMFEWEMRVQAFQNNVFIAMCNRVGIEGDMEFCGNSIVIDPDGNVILKSDEKEGLLETEINLSDADASRLRRPYIKTRRAQWY